MRLVELKTGFSYRHILVLQATAAGIALSVFLPALGLLVGWLVPVLALLMLPKRTLFSDPRAYGLAGLAFWSLREVGGTATQGFPAAMSSMEAVLYVALLAGCSILILSMFRLNPAIAVCPPRYRPRLFLIIQAAIAAALAAAYGAIPPDSEFLIPAEVVILGILCGGLICYRGWPLVVCGLAVVAAWAFDASVAVNRTGLLQTPVLVAMACVFRLTFFGRSARLLKKRYAMAACLAVIVAMPLSLLSKQGFVGDDYSGLQRIEKYFAGEVEFPFFADPHRYFDAFSEYRDVDTRGVSILTQMALAPLPRSAFPWKPPDILHYLDTIGAGQFLYIETFLLPIADLGVAGALFYAALPVLFGYMALALIGSNRRAYPLCYGMTIPIFYCVFMSQSGYPFSMAQFQFAPLAVLCVAKMYDALRG
jgi:hypothetical protein